MLKLRHYWLQFKGRCLSYPIAYFSKYCIRLILKTCRIEVKGLEEFRIAASKEGCLLMLWHNRLSLVAEIFNTHAPQFIYSAFVSKSRDGEIIALLAESYKAGRAIRVAHNAKHQALKMVINKLKQDKEIVLFTPDGPKGPCYKIKPGIALAAQQAKAPIIPFTWSANTFWQLKTWDQFRLPKPFSTISVSLGTPLYIDNTLSLDQVSEELEKSLHDLESVQSL
jgi:lysophospholipid acyltransferase (LPLAT)-like uncharacterized protein